MIFPFFIIYFKDMTVKENVLAALDTQAKKKKEMKKAEKLANPLTFLKKRNKLT